MYGPIGYYVTCDDALCAGCAPTGFEQGDYSAWPGFEGWDEPGAIFPDTESDTPTHCAECESLIAHNLTAEGIAYLAEAIVDGLATGSGRPEIHKAWFDAYGQEVDLDDWQELIGLAVADQASNA